MSLRVQTKGYNLSYLQYVHKISIHSFRKILNSLLPPHWGQMSVGGNNLLWNEGNFDTVAWAANLQICIIWYRISFHRNTNLSFADIDVPHDGTLFAWQFVTPGHPVTIARPNIGNCPVNITPAATQRATVVRVQAVPSSSRRTEVGWTMDVHQRALGHSAFRAPLPRDVVAGHFDLRLLIKARD